MATSAKRDKIELITDLLKVILWSLIVIIVAIVFWKPINNLLNNSESISVGNMTLRIKNEVPQPSNDVKQAINILSGKGVRELLYIGNDTTEYTGYDKESLEDAPIDELINAGLLKKAKFDRDTVKTRKYYKPTPLGVKTYDFYVDLINVFAKNISKPAEDEN